ncbi:MAG TPA: hypothetical protein VFS43_15570 [Polyangiaceae bacterium]|nr:hypothetical protein [Polyangiaceae bacterium]
MIVITAGALLTTSLASLSLGGCGSAEPAPGPGRRVGASAPGLRPADTPCDHGAEEYIDGNGEQVECGPTGPGEPLPDEPPEEPPPGPLPCEALPGGCFPEPDPDPPPPPPDPGDGGTPTPPPTSCTPAGSDCSAAQACCDNNYCAFGGERDATWCQPFESAAWEGSCAKPRAGAKLFNGALVCRELNGSEGPFRCVEMVGANCVIRIKGPCGQGSYHLHAMDLAQVESSQCTN